jgi:tetratricopeptide (TPR) repeat protein
MTADTKSPFRPGDLISNRYEVVAMVGQGGMGCVYEVRDRDLPARGSIALKTIRGDLAGRPDMAARFEREVRHALSVTHPNVCRTYDIGKHGEGEAAVVYLTMEFLPGERLSDWLAGEKGSKPVPETEALPVIRQLAAGLAAIHEQSIVHRDFKPGNVMLVKHGGKLRAVITDLGLARGTEAEGDHTVTQIDAQAGTPAYMAPEQLAGKSPLNQGADVYAFGITALELLVGGRVRREDAAETLRKLGVSSQLTAVIAGCIDRDPERRYKNAVDVVRQLDSASGTRMVGETATMTRESGRRPLGPRRLALVSVCIVAIAGLVIAFELGRPRISGRALELVGRATDQLSSNSFLDASRVLEQVVGLEPRYALAHAMLADAWNELELTGRASRELNKIEAADLVWVSSSDRAYIEGVRLTLTRDYTGAVEQFRRYFNRGDEVSKPLRAIALGRALEKARRPDEAAKAYGSAGNRGGALLALAVLNSRQQQITKALDGFAKARKEFEAVGEHGAVAGLEYQLGAAFNRWGKLPEAEAALKSCFEQARAVDDFYDELRCRHQLATIRLRRATAPAALDSVARDVAGIVEAADRPGFQILTARAWLLLAQVDAQRGKYEAADRDFSEAFTRAQSEDAGQLKAYIGFTEASLYLRNHRAADAEKPARAALADYEAGGYMKEAGQACILLSRALRDLGRLDEARRVILDKASLFASLSATEIAQMHEALASLESERDNYPAAIAQLEAAIGSAPDGPNVPLYRVGIAQMRIELGMLQEAREILSEARKEAALPPALEEKIHRIEATAHLYELKPEAALEDLRLPGKPASFLDPILAGLALIRINHAEDGIKSCDGAAKPGDRAEVKANIALCAAEGLAALHRMSDAGERLAQIDEAMRKDPVMAWRMAVLEAQMHGVGIAAGSGAAPQDQIRAAISALQELWGRDMLMRRLLRPDVQRDLTLAGLDKQRL